MPEYPLIGPDVLSVFEYIRREQEDIHLGEFTFDFLDFFGLPPGFNYNIDFFKTPVISDSPLEYSDQSYGVISTCEPCPLNTIEVEFTFLEGPIIAGPALRIVSDDKDNARLYAALYNPRDNLLVFVKYLNKSLISYGIKLAVVFNVNLHTGDIVKLSATGSFYSVYINGILVISNIHDTSIDNTNACTGVVAVQLNATPILKKIENIFENIYLVRVFYYCIDGISISRPLNPVNTATNFCVNDTSVILKSGEYNHKCYGFGYAQGFTNLDLAPSEGRGHYIESQFRYYTTISGSPISGPAFLIDESKADPDDFTGWVLLINKKLGKIQLCYYLNESLSDLPDPSHIVAEVTKSIANNTLVKIIASFADDVPDTSWTINVFTKQPTDGSYVNDIGYVSANQLPVGNQLTTRKERTNYGLAWVGNDGIGDHRAFWSGDIDQQYAIIN